MLNMRKRKKQSEDDLKKIKRRHSRLYKLSIKWKKNIKKENLKKRPSIWECEKRNHLIIELKKVGKWIKMKRPAYEDISDYV